MKRDELLKEARDVIVKKSYKTVLCYSIRGYMKSLNLLKDGGHVNKRL